MLFFKKNANEAKRTNVEELSFQQEIKYYPRRTKLEKERCGIFVGLIFAHFTHTHITFNIYLLFLPTHCKLE